MNERMLGGGVGRTSGGGDQKNASFSEPADLGGAAEASRGVASVSSVGRSREDGWEELEATEEERVSGGGGRSSAAAEKGEAKKALVFLPLEDGVGDGVEEWGWMSERAEDTEEGLVRMLRWDEPLREEPEADEGK